MRWPSFRHVFFDCDSTLTRVEGIDVLAEQLGKGASVKALTEAAMDGATSLENVYAKRLEVIAATRGEILKIRALYKKNIVEDAAAVIEVLHGLGHKVYIISGGLIEPVREFGCHLGVPSERIRAVAVEYDQLSGQWWSPDPDEYADKKQRYLAYRADALAVSDGKADIVAELLESETGRSLLIGDGVSDLLARRAVDLFVGFGGVVTRSRVAKEAPVFLRTSSLAPVLALAAGPSGIERTSEPAHRALFRKGLDLLSADALSFNDQHLGRRFSRALEAVNAGGTRMDIRA